MTQSPKSSTKRSSVVFVAVLLGLAGALTALFALPGCTGSDSLQDAVIRIVAGQLAAMMDDGQPLTVIDVRTPTEYAAGSIPGSVNLPLADLDTWAGTLDKTRRVCCVCACTGRNGISHQAATRLVALGYQRVYDLEGGLQTWPNVIPNNSSIHNVDSAGLQALMSDGQPLLIVDVRTPEEYATGHIPGSVNHPIGDIDTWAATLQTGQRLCCVCGVGARSRTAAAILVGKGFLSVYNLLGGMQQWTGAVE